MSQQQYLKKIQTELRELNQRIDAKIMRGERYSEESRRHKMLLRKMHELRPSSFFGRLFAY